MIGTLIRQFVVLLPIAYFLAACMGIEYVWYAFWLAEEDKIDDLHLIMKLLNCEVVSMMYPFMTLNDGTEIVHSDMDSDGRVKVYVEKPDEMYCFRHAVCWLPDYSWEDVY